MGRAICRNAGGSLHIRKQQHPGKIQGITGSIPLFCQRENNIMIPPGSNIPASRSAKGIKGKGTLEEGIAYQQVGKMRVLVLNGSPAGENSITLQTVRFIEKVVDVQVLDCLLADLMIFVRILLRGHPALLCGDGYGCSVLIGSTDHEHFVAQQEVVSSEDVGRQKRSCDMS